MYSLIKFAYIVKTMINLHQLCIFDLKKVPKHKIFVFRNNTFMGDLICTVIFRFEILLSIT